MEGNEAQGQKYLSITDVATKLSVSIHAVTAWRKRGEMPVAYKFGKLVRWLEIDIDKWVNEKKEMKRKKDEHMEWLGQHLDMLKSQGRRFP